MLKNIFDGPSKRNAELTVPRNPTTLYVKYAFVPIPFRVIMFALLVVYG